MYVTEVAIAVAGAIAMVLIAISLFQGLLILRSAQRRSLRAQTQRTLKEDLNMREELGRVLDLIRGDTDTATADEVRTLPNRLRRALDYAESIALGVRYGIYDERMIRDAYGQLFVALHAHAERTIDELRYNTNNPDTYAAFSFLVDEWVASARHRRLL